MKLIIIAILFPAAVFGECPTLEPVTCHPADLLCGGEPDADGCATPMWCMGRYPYEACSATLVCPVTCPEGTSICSGGQDADGCPMPDHCIPDDTTQCSSEEMMCPGGLDTNGCQMPSVCIPVDPNCPTNCPVHCSSYSNQHTQYTTCPGGQDDNGCAMPDTCMAFIATAVCNFNCPVYCPNEYPCPSEMGSDGCSLPDTCSVNGECPTSA